MAHPNEELVREGFAAFARGDMEALDRFFTDDATWHAWGDNPLSGDFEGKIENERVTSAWLHGYDYQKTDEFWT